ncbi:hypothetical protein EYF80_039003 [Liparis tanakae]|uniref:Uncharacterized protein n=1 Tax=Liparis tanakae TaxID=230148 RepID=A0A4Z2GC26_9TELE|nr:hypothetical protein EYF80_039003 [Liparis tanakae]
MQRPEPAVVLESSDQNSWSRSAAEECGCSGNRADRFRPDRAALIPRWLHATRKRPAPRPEGERLGSPTETQNKFSKSLLTTERPSPYDHAAGGGASFMLMLSDHEAARLPPFNMTSGASGHTGVIVHSPRLTKLITVSASLTAAPSGGVCVLSVGSAA